MLKSVISNTKIQFISLVLILIFSVVFILFYIGTKINNLSEINILHNDLNRFTTISSNLENKLNKFKTYKHSNGFFEIYADESTAEIVNNELILFDLIKKLKQNNNVREYNILIYLEQNYIILNDYSNKFTQLIKSKVEIGNAKFGYTEKINYSEQRIENLLINDIFLKASFKNIKILRKQYNQSYSIKNADYFVSETQKFISTIKGNNNYNELTKRLLLDASVEYLNYFIQIKKLQNKIGNKYYYGLYSELNALSNELIMNVSTSIEQSKNYINKDYRKFKIRTLTFIAIASIIIMLILFFMYRVYFKGIYSIHKRLRKLIFSKNKDTFSDGNFYKGINIMLDKHIDNIKYKKDAIYDFALGKPKENYIFNENDELGQSITFLKTKIFEEINKSIEENAKRKIEDNHKEGIAKFGRILRRHVGDIDTLSYEIISELVSFLNADIGGIYVTDENKNLNLRASFAYNEKKILTKQIPFGEGLIGTCAIDKSSIFIDKVDDDYIKIISGFGHTKPTSIIISPIMVEGEVYGVIELGSTHLFNQNDINFIESLAEDIAYTLSYLLSLEKKGKEI